MYPNQQQYSQPGGGAGYPYPPNPQQQQQQPPFNNQPSYGVMSGLASGLQPNMSAPYGNNPGGYGGFNNPYGQGSNPYAQGSNPQGGSPYAPGSNPQGGNPYAQGSNPQGGNPYGQSGYGMSGGSSGYPASGQQPFGGNSGSGYPPPQSGGYPGQQTPYRPQGGGYPGGQQGSGYPGGQQGGGYPGGQQAGGYPGNQQGGGFGGPGGFAPNDPRAQRLNQVIQQYEINQQFAARLHALGNCEIVVLCDDSGSMNTPLDGSTKTRWDELKTLVNIVVDISAVMDSNGVDVYFLNREPVLNVTNAQTIRHVFNNAPQGLTPLVPAIRRIIASKRSQAYEKKLLILIATDGAPTNEYGQTDIGSLEHVLRTERTPQTYVTFLACTDDLQAVNYLSNWDKSMANMDVIDDYRSERAEIQRTRGTNFPFSFGDYIVKALLGSIDPWFDSLDERA